MHLMVETTILSKALPRFEQERGPAHYSIKLIASLAVNHPALTNLNLFQELMALLRPSSSPSEAVGLSPWASGDTTVDAFLLCNGRG